MYSEKVRRIPRVSSSRKDKFRERERYRRSFWGTVFLELVLQKIEEDEFFDLEEQEEGEKAACRKKNASSPRILKAELGGKSAGKRVLSNGGCRRSGRAFVQSGKIFWCGRPETG